MKYSGDAKLSRLVIVLMIFSSPKAKACGSANNKPMTCILHPLVRECSGSVVKYFSQGVVGLSLTSVTKLCP